MSVSDTTSAYLQGIRDGFPFLFVVAPFAVLFGVVATEAGLDIAETMGFSIIVIAGAAQFTALQLMEDNAPTLIVVLTALAVNLRMAMYSASLTPHLGAAPMWKRAVMAYFLVDQSYALANIEYETRPDRPLSEKVAYYFGAVTPICPFWYVLTLAGALAGAQIPPEYALDFALPIAFIAMIAPAIRTPAHLVAALVSVCAALSFAFLPYNLGLIVSAILAMVAGAQVELWMERRGTWH